MSAPLLFVHLFCFSSAGKRRFQKRLFCNWTGGYKWSTALALRWGDLWRVLKLNRINKEVLKQGVRFFCAPCFMRVFQIVSLQHYSGRLRGGPVLSGPVERGPGQTVQLRRPGHLDSHRCSTNRGGLCGTCWRFALHLKQSSGDVPGWFVPSSASHRFPLKYPRSEMLCS